ncbi:O-antigen ligase family protein [Ferrimonas balearica]|uniref:O-antigen ligase family protein n=1 Tax=Ferrimonas balearica TaxID=44012 RepID=UPI001C99DF5E|nr:O-antigen ligase family protein [Ferrimonas balearica]MBY5994261.1 O-antigen ligase family protein [Ferrimonas balearica]
MNQRALVWQPTTPISLVLGSFLLYWVLAITMVKLELVLPVRVWVLLVGLGSLLLLYRVQTADLFNDNPHLPALGALTVIGVLTSLWGTLDWAGTLLMTIKWMLQPAMTFLFTLLICRLIGVRPVAQVFVLVIALTCTVAVMQGLDIQAAWDLKYRFETWQGLDRDQVVALEQVRGSGEFDDQYRARGLSYSPVHLGYQIALVVALFYYARSRAPQLQPFSPLVVKGLLVLLFAAAIFSGTRSTIGGLLLLWPAHLLLNGRNRGMGLMLVLAGIAIAPLLFVLAAQVLELRIFSTSDTSLAARVPLSLLGLQLFLDNPLGHGWLVEASDLADQYWHQLYRINNAEVVVYRGIHNHAVKMLFVYGLLGAAVFLAYLLRLKRQYGMAIWVALVPYAFHALFHNDGIFLGGNYIWVWLAMIHFDYLERRAHDQAD